MDTRAHGQPQSPYCESSFERYARFEAQEDTPTAIQSRHRPSDFILFGWLNEKPKQQQFTDSDQLLGPLMKFSAQFG
jgi:hypothetical protein